MTQPVGAVVPDFLLGSRLQNIRGQKNYRVTYVG